MRSSTAMCLPPRARVAQERGASLVVTMILVTGLLAVSALALYLSTADNQAVRYTVDSRTTLYCAESGLAGARAYVAGNVSSWPLMLDASASNDPTGYPVTGDLDGDGNPDWQVTLKDNDDEFPTDNPDVDSDGVVYMVATCIANTESEREVMELVSVGGGGTNYRTQAGGGGGNTGNLN
jgi:hypothetical protein